MAFVDVARLSGIPPGAAVAVEVNGKQLAVFNLRGEIFAIDDECSHAGGSLSEGPVDGDTVTCPWHGAAFNIKTGQALSEPASEAVKSYQVKIQGDVIQIDV